MIYLKLPDETTFDSIMDSLSLKIVNEKEANTFVTEYKTNGDDYNMLIVGTVPAPTGNTIDTDDDAYDEDGNLVPLQEYAPVEGFHVNLKIQAGNSEEVHPVLAAFSTYVIEAPATPYVRW